MRLLLSAWRLTLLALFLFVLSLNWVELWFRLREGQATYFLLAIPTVALVIFIGSGFRLANSLFWLLGVFALSEWLYLYGDQGVGWISLISLIFLEQVCSRDEQLPRITWPALLLMTWAAVVSLLQLLQSDSVGSVTPELSWADVFDYYFVVSSAVIVGWYSFANGYRLRQETFYSPLFPLVILTLIWIGSRIQLHEYLYYFSGRVKYNIHPQFSGACYLLVMICFAWSFFNEDAHGRIRRYSLVSRALVLISSILLILQLPSIGSNKAWLIDYPIHVFSQLSTKELIFGLGPSWPGRVSELLGLQNIYHLYSFPLSSGVAFILEGGVVGLGLAVFTMVLSLREIGSHPVGLKRKLLLLLMFVLWLIFLPGFRNPLMLCAAVGVMGIIWKMGKKRQKSLSEEFIDLLCVGAAKLFSFGALVCLFALIILAIAKVRDPIRVFKDYSELTYPDVLKINVVAMEDLLFYQHHGIDFARLKWVIADLAKTGKIDKGASTISMQLAKVLYLDYQKSFLRKSQQFLIALYLEYALSKEQILHQYLSVLDFAHGQIGVNNAAHYYFDKPAALLSTREAELLSLSIRNPWDYNPALPLRGRLRNRLYQLRANRSKFGDSLTRPTVFLSAQSADQTVPIAQE